MTHHEMVAMLLAGGKGTRLLSLTKKVAKPAVFYGGKYRIIDFPLSNAANSGITNVGVLTQFAAAILRGEPLVAEGYEGINGLTLSNAMHLSAWTESKVTLPIDEDLYYEELMKRVKTSRRKTNVVETVADTSGTY